MSVAFLGRISVPLGSWTLAFSLPMALLKTSYASYLALDMKRMDDARRLAADPLWEWVKCRIRNDTRDTRGRKVFDETAFVELKYLLCVKAAWGDTEGGQDGLFGATSLQCDKQWHTFILNTKNYQSMCESIFGEFIHHTPVYHRPSSDRLINNARTALKMIWNVEFSGISKVSLPMISDFGTNTDTQPIIDVGKVPVDVEPAPAKKIKLSAEPWWKSSPDPGPLVVGCHDDSSDSEEEEGWTCG